jgi:hypothetical protein
MKIEALRDELRQPGVRVGIGVWLMPLEYVGKEEAIAARLDLQALDARLAYLESLPAGVRFSGLTRPDGYQNLTRLLRDLSQRIHRRDCLLVHTLDLLLLGLEVTERNLFWYDVLGRLPYPRTKLILAIPEKASELFSFDLRRRYTAQVAEGSLE